MGDADGTGTLTAKRILVIAKPAEDKRRAIFGVVTKVTSSTITLKDWTVKLSSTTKYTGKTKASDIKVGAKLIIVGTVTSDKNLTAKLVHLLKSP